MGVEKSSVKETYNEAFGKPFSVRMNIPKMLAQCMHSAEKLGTFLF
jgi:hypothetical protein